MITFKIKITVYRKHLVFYNSCLTHSSVWIKVCQILLNFKCNESSWNLNYFNFFLKKECLEIMQIFYSHVNLNLTCKKNINKNKLNFRMFLPNFLSLYPSKTWEKEITISRISSFIYKTTHFSTKIKIFVERKVFSLFLAFSEFA